MKEPQRSPSPNSANEPLKNEGSEKPIQSDNDLWNAFRSGKNAAFLSIYKTYFNTLYSYGIRIKDDEDLVKDAIQDLFLDLKKNCGSLGETDSIKFYLFKCLKRKIYKELRAWDSSKQILEPSQSFEITFSHEDVLINQQLDQEKSRLINNAISQLSTRKREAIYYIYYEGMNYQQVADLLELQDSKSARDLTYKALRSLRESIGYLPIFFITYLP